MEGTRLGPYRLLEELGAGGMGRVFRAEVVDGVPGLKRGAQVALKIIHTHLLESPGFFQRFLREADIGRSVRHGNVVRTYLADALLQEGVQRNFLVMELVEGQTLRELLKELERIPEALCRHVGREVAKGLTAVHDAGVIHRDIKPENLLITKEHAVKVMDLGVARLKDEELRISRTGSFVGSLEYAAPEQIHAAGAPVDGRADLFALGTVLYELATGQHPFRDTDARRVLHKILSEDPRDPGDVNPQLSPFLGEVIATLLAKDPRERFASAGELVGVLETGEACVWWRERARVLRIETRKPLRRIRVPRETAIYGRDGDLATLSDAFSRAKEGEAQVLLIEGEAGIGKTRLVDEFVGRLRQEGEEIHFLFGSYPPGGAATAAGAFTTAYREHFGDVGLEETLRQYLKPTPVLIPSFAALLRGESTPTGAETLTKDSLQTVFVHATRALSAELPTIVLIDDLHFAPEEGRALFMSLALAVPGHRVLLLGTCRRGLAEDWVVDLERQAHASQLPLHRLGPKDLIHLLEDAFRSKQLAERLGVQVALKSDGNPYFAFEIIRGLRDGQLITKKPDGTWVTTQEILEIQIPSSVLDLVNARLAGLSDAERDLLDVASCWGFDFDPLLVGEICGLDPIPALKALGRIERRHRIVRSIGRRYQFDHHQVQEALYEALSEQLSSHYHTALADALEHRTGAATTPPSELDGALAVDLSEHFLQGVEGERGLRYLDASLDHLERGYANAQAIRLADRALDAPALVPARRAALLMRKAGWLGLLGRRDQQELTIDAALALTREHGDRALEATALTEQGTYLWAVARHDEATKAFEQALETVRDIGPPERESTLISNLGLVSWVQGRFEEALGHFEHSLTLAREREDRAAETRATGNLGLVHMELGHYDDALARSEACITMARAVGDRRTEATATGNQGLTYWLLGRYGEARESHKHSLAIAREIGDRMGEARATGNVGLVLWSLGHYEEAVALYDRQIGTAREIADRRSESIGTENRGLALLALGRHEEALEHHERHLALVREIHDRAGEARAMSNLGAVYRAQGRLGEAVDHYGRHVEIAREIKDRRSEAVALRNLGSARTPLGNAEAAQAALDAALLICREIGARDYEASTLLALGELALLRGDDAAAREWMRGALDLYRELGKEGNVATAQIELARLDARAGDAASAIARLEEASQLARKLNLAGTVVRADAHLAVLTGELRKAQEGWEEFESRIPHDSQIEIRFTLWQANGGAENLEEAHRLLLDMRDHVPVRWHGPMLERVPLHREIMAAWAVREA